jgi:hypothetical protein
MAMRSGWTRLRVLAVISSSWSWRAVIFIVIFADRLRRTRTDIDWIIQIKMDIRWAGIR